MILEMWESFFKAFIPETFLEKSYNLSEWFVVDFDLILLIFSFGTLWFLLILPLLRLIRKWNGTAK